MNKKAIYSFALSTTLAIILYPTTNYAAQEYSFGVVPQTNGSKLSQLWSPILQYLEKNSGIDLRFSTARNISTFEKRVESGKYDFVYMNPYHYTLFHDKQGYNAFAKAKKKRLKGIVVVLKDSPYRSLNDLNNAELAFPSNAFAANLVPRAVLTKNSLDYTSKYVSSHDSVYRNIARGRYPAGGGVMRTFNNTSPEYRDKLRILWTSDGYTPHAFAAHPRIPQDVVDKLQKALLEMENSPQGKALLKDIRLIGIEKGIDKEWDDVRALNIKS
ncbi:MAG: phosphate/phosphite/phosphonate ABC transporter substrate-binding protein [Gammaproteobacteria bacterium]|nr:phosphate/phosphite/phosphonate ABC transporter substrate-binding protein [Gammaproteobacteria bacterium]MCW8987919.1 phosphate/phosphite/phosphonate ABC transporter substrate-binding protein [Gammaproteobacteria bacterium]